jgi:acyl CoA:acetate/3-ketoacid CoA transferase beta subunit
MMDHCTKGGESKLMRTCTYPQTGYGVVKTIFTDLAVIDVTDQGFVAREIAKGLSLADIQAKTNAPLTLSDNYVILEPPELN